MKMIASTKLAKAQRAMQNGKEYGKANSGRQTIHRSCLIVAATFRGISVL